MVCFLPSRKILLHPDRDGVLIVVPGCVRYPTRLLFGPAIVRPIHSRYSTSMPKSRSHYLHSNPQESLQAVRSMKMALGQLEDWMKVNRLKLNQDKTQFMWIGRKQMLDKINREVLHSHFPDMKFLSSVNDLGVVLDERLEMEEQIGSICRSGFYHLRQNRGIRRSLTDVAARLAVQAFIMSKVDNCNSALQGLSATMVDRVQHLMNAAARLILRLPKFSHTSAQMRDDLHWLSIPRRIQFKIMLTTWRCISGSAPDYLQELCCLLSTIPGRRQLRSTATSRYLLDVPKVRTVTMQKRAFAHAGPTLWNTIPEALRSRVMNYTLDTVKKQLKSFLFAPSG